MPSKPVAARAFAPLILFFLIMQVGSAVALHLQGVALSGDMIRYMAGGVGVAALAMLAGWLFCGVGGFVALTVFASVVLMSPGSVLFSYACIAASASFPLGDAQLAAIDAAMGFDWMAVTAWLGASPTMSSIFGFFYHKTIIGLLYALVFLCVIGRHDRLLGYFWHFTLAALACNLIAVFLPAAGAFVHHAPPADIRGAIPATSGIWHLDHFQALRAGAFAVFNLDRAQGLITFPSFHTAGALLIPIALRGYGPITLIASLFAAFVVASTISIGGHYLIDIIAGAILAFALLPLVTRIVAASVRRPAAAEARPDMAPAAP